MIRTLPHILAALLICLLGSGGLLWLHHEAVDMQAAAMAADGEHVHHHNCHHHHHAPASPGGSDEDGSDQHPDCPECVMLGAAKPVTLTAPPAIIGDELSEEKLVVRSLMARGIQFRELPPARGPPAA